MQLSLKILTQNVYCDSYIDFNFEHVSSRIARLIKVILRDSVDVVALQEVYDKNILTQLSTGLPEYNRIYSEDPSDSTEKIILVTIVGLLVGLMLFFLLYASTKKLWLAGVIPIVSLLIFRTSLSRIIVSPIRGGLVILYKKRYTPVSVDFYRFGENNSILDAINPRFLLRCDFNDFIIVNTHLTRGPVNDVRTNQIKKINHAFGTDLLVKHLFICGDFNEPHVRIDGFIDPDPSHTFSRDNQKTIKWWGAQGFGKIDYIFAPRFMYPPVTQVIDEIGSDHYGLLYSFRLARLSDHLAVVKTLEPS